MVELLILKDTDREQFIKDNQFAFRYGATEEFGKRDAHYEEEGEIISRKTIEDSIDNGRAYRIVDDERNAGGLVLHLESDRGFLDLLFTSPELHGKGIGYAAWCEVERLYPQVKIWETCTPYFETRNIHFYINKCGFHAVEFFNVRHPDPNDPEEYTADENTGTCGFDGMFRFEKQIDCK